MKKPALYLLKIGGKVLDDAVLLKELLNDFAAMNQPKILVHGGGQQASRLSRSLGIEPKMHQGRRITDTASLEVATMVYAGLLSKNIVATLQSFDCPAVGLSGADGNTLLAGKRPAGEVDFGWVGDVKKVDTRLPRKLLESGMTPVFCAITHDGKGQLFNTNADTIACRLAIALAPYYHLKLVYCFEKPGVLRSPENDESIIELLTLADYHRYKEEGIIQGGMLPKLDNAFMALENEVAEVVIGNPDSLKLGRGTFLQR
ncbi:MAG: acetylglutamate kinase [Saprospiraceae bacterium]|nr:acetylglutamate kinase [Saprospiraceae bacterium]